MSKYIYLLHFQTPIHHAQHYTGITTDLAERMVRHFNGSGSKLTAEFARLKIAFTIARVWEGAAQEDERRMKEMKNGRQYCPVCNKTKARKLFGELRPIPKSALKQSGLQLTYKHEG